MTVGDWVRQTARAYRDHGVLDGSRSAARNSFESVLRRVDPHVGGWHVYDDPWDVLVVVDACRFDLLRDAVIEFDWLDRSRLKRRRSLATATRTWMRRTFTEERAEEMRNTVYIAGNPYSGPLLDADEFLVLDEVHQYAWNDGAGTLPARPVTERAVSTHRSMSPDRTIVHYLQPHFPSIPDPLGYGMAVENFEDPEGGVEWNSVWDALRAGEMSTERVSKSYAANLRYVLEEVELLVDNLDAERVVLTSDHGNAFGEWFTYGHPPEQYVPVNRTVPFVRVDARDTNALEPTLERPASGSYESDELNARLGALGYR